MSDPTSAKTKNTTGSTIQYVLVCKPVAIVFLYGLMPIDALGKQMIYAIHI